MLTGGGSYDITDPDVILSIDLKNAYNSIRRGVIHNALERYLPGLQCFFHWAYGVHSPLYLADGTLATTSNTGVRQGDPISALVFCLGIHGTLKDAQVKHPKVTVMAYIDDIYLAGPRSEVYRTFRHLRPKFQHIGLTVELDKCHLYDNTCDDDETEWEGCHCHNDGIMVLGSPVGSPEYEQASTQQILSEQGQSISWIAEELPANTAYKILQACINARPNFLIRTVWPAHTEKPTKSFDTLVDHAIRDICGLQDNLDETGQILRGLPLQMGGGSIRRTFETSQPAYAASFLAATKLIPTNLWLQALEDTEHFNALTAIMKEVIPNFQGFDADGATFADPDPGSQRADIDGPWNQRTADADQVQPIPQTIQSNKENSQQFHEKQKTPQHSQRHLCQHQDRIAYNKLHTELRTSCPGKAAQLLSATCPRAASWVLGPQAGNPKTFLQPKQYADNIMLRLLQTPINGVREHQVIKCKCDKERALSSDEEHTHYLTCPLLHGTRSRRHTSIKEDLTSSLKVFPGVSNLTTEQLLSADKENQPDYKTDISFQKQGKTYHIDLNVSAPVTKEALKTGSADWAGTACCMAVKIKKKKWSKSMNTLSGFVPFILEPTGRIGAGGLELINNSITKPPEGEDPGISVSKWKRELTLKISCSMARYNSYLLEQFRRNVSISQEGRHHKPTAPPFPRTRHSSFYNTTGKERQREKRPILHTPPEAPHNQQQHAASDCQFEGCSEDEHFTAICRHCKEVYCLAHLKTHDCPDFHGDSLSVQFPSANASETDSLAADLAKEGIGPTQTQDSHPSIHARRKEQWNKIMEEEADDYTNRTDPAAKEDLEHGKTEEDKDDISSTCSRKSARLLARAQPR